MFKLILKFFSGLIPGGGLGRILDTVDKHVDAQSDRERIKADIVKEFYRSRSDYMNAGGFKLMLIFAIPLGGWFASVCLYSVLFCSTCLMPQNWTIAALPKPLNEWSGMIILSIFGIVGLQGRRK